MKLLLLFLMLVFCLPFAFASIEITSELKEYNLGDDIGLSVKITPDVTANALVKLMLKCTNKEILYYTAPVSLEEGVEVSVEAPLIKAFSEGLCSIRVNVESLEGEDLEGINSDEFTISDRLELSFTVDKTDVLPGDRVKIEGSASKKGDKIVDGSIIVRFDDKKVQMELDNAEFSYEIRLDEDIKSGEHTVIVEVSDPYGNYNEEGISIDVEAVPTMLVFGLNKKEFNPTETLELVVDLLDQANDSMGGSAGVRLFREKTLFKDEIVIFDTRVGANEGFSFTFNYSTLPYDYKLIGSFGELEKEEVITILPYPKIEMSIEGYNVIVRNVGNVEYNDETKIILEKENKTYILDKKIKLDVGEETVIDLSKKVSSGNYTVTLPGETVVEERIVEKEVPIYIEKEKEVEEEVNVIEDVEIEDNRPLYKKGFSWITGGGVAGTGLLVSRPKLGLFVMIIVILSLIGYYNRGRIGRIIEKIRERRIERL